MPGLYGIADLNRKPDRSILESLERAVSPDNAKVYNMLSDNISLGFKSLGILDPNDQPFIEGDLTLFFWGEIFTALPENTTIAQYIFSLYRDDRLNRLGDINAFFSFALWDKKKQTLILACDIHGTRPLYYFHDAGRIIFGPNPFALSKAIGVTEIDNIALHHFLAFSAIFGDHTWIKGIKKLRYGQHLMFDRSGPEITQYFTPARNPKRMTLNEAAENTLKLLSRSVTQMAKVKTALSISGGGDSRLLAAICRQNDIPVQSFTYGSAKSEDIRIARKVADSLDIGHHPLLISNDFLKSYLREAVYNTGGYVSAVNFHGISTRSQVKKICNICLSGLYGNNYLGYLSFGLLRFMAGMKEADFKRNLSHSLASGTLSTVTMNLRAREILRTVVDDLAARYRQSTHYETVMMIDHFEINSQKSLAGIWLENDTLEFRSPYCDHELLRFNLSIPAKYLRLMKLGRKIWQKYFPGPGKIEYQRTGLPLTASIPWVLIRKIMRSSKTQKFPPAIMDYDYIFRRQINDWAREFLTSKDSMIPEYINNEIMRQMSEGFSISKTATLLVIEQVLRIINNQPQ